MTNEKISAAYKIGYEMGRKELEDAKPELVNNKPMKAVKELINEFKFDERIFDGIIAAVVDYEMGNEWEF